MSERSEIAGTAGGPHPDTHRSEPTAHEAYAFACMRCGHAWEQAYEIEHHVDAEGHTFVVYLADGERVPSPLTRPTCLNCGAHVVRIMRAGQVSQISQALANLQQRHPRRHGEQAPEKRVTNGSEADAEGEAGNEADGRAHHWHLSVLLHPFQHRG